MSTLADELFEAANCLENDKLHRLADRLRQRAARVRELEQRINAGAGIVVDLGGFVRMLTGPDIPAETAPNERTET